jgi:hypothetical protein
MVKDIFLDKYNPKRDVHYALTQSIKASLQHNPTYTKDIDDFLKTEFRDYWKVRLQQIGEYFLEVRDLNFYLDQVVLFTAEMNSKFFQVLSPNKENYENGIKTGKCLEYYSDGKLRYLTNYKFGKNVDFSFLFKTQRVMLEHPLPTSMIWH